MISVAELQPASPRIRRRFGFLAGAQYQPVGSGRLPSCQSYTGDINSLVSQALYTFRRDADTNQRINFDIDPSGRYLASGSVNREVLLYDLEKQDLAERISNQADAVSSVSFHPHAPLLAIGTGQRHFDPDVGAGSDSDDMLDDRASDSIGTRADDTTDQVRNGIAIYKVGETNDAFGVST